MEEEPQDQSDRTSAREENGLPAASILIQASRVLNSTLELPQLQDEVLRLLCGVCAAEAAVLLVVGLKMQNFILMRGYQRQSDSFLDFPPRQAGQLLAWVQSANPAGQTTPGLLPDDVDAAVRRLAPQHEVRTQWSALRRRGRMSGAVGIVFTEDGQPDRRAVLTALSDQIATALDNALLFRAVRRRSTEARILLQSTLALAGGLDLDEILTTILDKLREVIEYDAAGIFLFDKEQEKMVPISHRGWEGVRLHLVPQKSDEGLVGHAVQTGETVLVADVRTDPRYKNARDATLSELVIPIAVRGRVIGAFDLERDLTDGFSQDDVHLATAFAGSAGIAIERARLYRESLEKRRLDGELEIARSIQQRFIPKKNPKTPGYDIAGMNIPSEEVGGDYYDFIPIVENQLGIAIADVSGKGIPAALIMAAFRASLIAEIRNNYAIRTIFEKVNRLLEETGERGSFVTAMYGVLDTKNGVLTFANAGHNPGLLMREDGTIVYLIEGGVAFGVLPHAHYEERPVSIRPGDIMLWYTDGVTEATNGQDEQFGIERLEEALRRHRDCAAEGIVQAIHQEIMAFAAPDAIMDDLTMVAVKALQ